MLCYENRNYLLCTLKKGVVNQVPLDLNFQEGTKIAFTCNGFGHVHLTGYLTLDEDLDFGDLEEEDEEEEMPQLVKPKRKAVDTLKKTNKKLRKESTEDDDSSEDDLNAESDSDEDDTKVMNADDLEDESEDDSEDDEDEDDESDDEPEPEVTKSKQKQKQNQQVLKQDKQKIVNGKEAKQEMSKQKKNKPEKQQQNTQQQPKKRIFEGGVQVEDIKVGNGAPAKPGKNVTVYYVGRLKNGKKFDETRQGEGFKFQLGKSEVIQGWDIGISGMKVGGKRRLTIPPAMGYVLRSYYVHEGSITHKV